MAEPGETSLAGMTLATLARGSEVGARRRGEQRVDLDDRGLVEQLRGGGRAGDEDVVAEAQVLPGVVDVRLRERISAAVIVEAEPTAHAGVVGFGSSVQVRDQDGREQTWKIVSSHDAAPGEGRLSVESPVASALLGRAAGQKTSVVLPKGTRELTIVSVD